MPDPFGEARLASLVNWQPFDFGLRHAKVESAAAARDRANATVQRSQLEVSSAAADAFLTVLAARSGPECCSSRRR